MLWQWGQPAPSPYAIDYKQLDSLQQLLNTQYPADSAEERIISLHPWNPNTEDSAGLLTLGFEPWQIRSLIKYRTKGGHFRTKADVRRLYGLSQEQYAQLLPYILLPDTLVRQAKPHETYERAAPVATWAHEVDSLVLESWPLLGMTTAKRIIQYRDRLGGFHDTAQYREVWGLTEQQLQVLKTYMPIDPEVLPRTIALNRATEQELAGHPYLTRKMVRLILAYRKQHGSFKSWQDLSSTRAFTESELLRMRPYLNLEY